MKAKRAYWIIFTATSCNLLSAEAVDENEAPPRIEGETGRRQVSASMYRRWMKMVKRGGGAKVSK